MVAKRKPRKREPIGARAKYQTRLGRWCVEQGVRVTELAAVSGLSRQWLSKSCWRAEFEDQASLKTMRLVLWSARQLRGRHVQMADLYNLEPDPVRE